MFKFSNAKRFFFSLVVLTLSLASGFAQNHVLNGSFEAIEECPTGLSSSGFASFVTGVDTTHDFVRLAEPWYCPTSGTSDLLAECATNNMVTVPESMWGSSDAKTGENYAALILYHNIADNWADVVLSQDYTEYIQAPLESPLVPGDIYSFSMWFRRGENSRFAIDQLGMALSIGPITEGDEINPEPLELVPTAVTPEGTVQDSDDWQELTATFIAAEAYDHITIGRFLKSIELTVEDVSTAVLPSTLRRAVYFIDDVSLMPVETVSLEETNANKSVIRGTAAGVQVLEQGELFLFDALGRVMLNRFVSRGEIIPWPNDVQQGQIYFWRLNGSALRMMATPR